MLRHVLICVAVAASLGWTSTAHAVNFFWTGPVLGGPGGNFRTASNWTFTPPPFPLEPAPGGADDTANFNLGRDLEDRYTVTNVHGENDRLIVHDDSLMLVVPDVNVGAATDYELSNGTTSSPSLTIGVALGDVADVILAGGGGRAVVSNQATTIGRAALSTGILTVTDELRLIGSGNLMVGESGTGTLTIENGAVVSNSIGKIGLNSGIITPGTGTVTVTGAGSAWNNSLDLWVGGDGEGTLVVENGGSVENITGFIAAFTGSTGTATVTGGGSSWNNSSQLQVGSSGTGTLMIAGGGEVSSSEGLIGTFDGSSGTATVNGAGSAWTNSGRLGVGESNIGELTISDGGSVTNDIGRIGVGAAATGTVTVTGVGSTWTSSDELHVGDAGDGTLVIADGGTVSNTNGRIGDQNGSTGMATVSGAGSIWANSGSIIVGDNGDGVLHIESGGSVTSGSVRIAFSSGNPTGEVVVTGAGSTLTSNLGVDVGGLGTGQLTISDGGNVSAGFNCTVGGNTAPGVATVTSLDSNWTMAGALTVGFLGTGTLNVQNGGSVSSTSGAIGRQAGSTGTVTVSGLSTPGSAWAMTGRLSIAGYAPTGIAGGTGTLNISPGGTVDVGEDSVLFPNGLLRLQGGTLATAGISFEGGGQFQWTSGTLHIGIFEGNLTNPSGGTLAPGRSAGSTTILGDYTQSAGATLEIEIGGAATASGFDFVDVQGTATLGGTLRLALINDFVPEPTDEFVIFNADDLISFFTNAGNNARLDTVDGLGSFLVHYGPTSAFDPNQIVLSDFIATLVGDYNDDGSVDAADFVVWQDNEGTTNHLPNDPIGGVIGPAHYDQWRVHFGQSAGSGATSGVWESAAVPEPATLLVLQILGANLTTFWRRITRRRSPPRTCAEAPRSLLQLRR